ncbi:MAG: DUF481 domain-containing protein [Sphingobium sp.]
MTLSRFARSCLPALAAALSCAATPARADIPPAVDAMIREAHRTGDATTLSAVLRVAKATNPDDAPAIDALARSLVTYADEKAKRDREAMLAAQGYFEGWTGQGQAGFGLSSGNTEQVSGVIGISLKKEGLRMRHKVEALVDYLRTSGITTREKFGASYGLDYKRREGFYLYGIIGWEQDRFAGYTTRFTESLGAGLRVVNKPDMTLDLDLGPALRQTFFTDGTNAFEIGPRASATYKWSPGPGMTVSEIASVISGDQGTTLISDTAFTSKITGSLSGRLSFNVQTESDRASSSKPTDTATRATLVYEF